MEGGVGSDLWSIPREVEQLAYPRGHWASQGLCKDLTNSIWGLSVCTLTHPARFHLIPHSWKLSLGQWHFDPALPQALAKTEAAVRTVRQEETSQKLAGETETARFGLDRFWQHWSVSCHLGWLKEESIGHISLQNSCSPTFIPTYLQFNIKYSLDATTVWDKRDA